MADRRGVRSASRRQTPTPQPPSKVNTPSSTRASRARSLRSASRDVEPIAETPKPTRRSVRQASITATTDESENDGKTRARLRRRPAKEAVTDLTVVEEVSTQIEIQDPPGTPRHSQPEIMVPYRSPTAHSEMSGTTYISSFSMGDAEFLEPRYMLKHIHKLCDSAQEFLEHLAPQDGAIQDDMRHIQEIQQPDSDFSKDYRDYDDVFMVHVAHFKTEGTNYINVRAVHRALFGPDDDIVATQTGLDIVLYLANLLVFAKQMIHSDRASKDVWDALRQLDNTFPSQFMHSLTAEEQGMATLGESTLLQETFDLALNLRTHLAILIIERSASNSDFDLDASLSEVFFRSEASQEAGSILRGWNLASLGGEDSALISHFEQLVIDRFDKIRSSCLLENCSEDGMDSIDLEGLSRNFTWEANILRLLEWVRLRHNELRTAVTELGGAATIVTTVKQELERLQHLSQQVDGATASQESPRRRRKSFGRNRRRSSSRKFDPNAPVDVRAIDALKAREKLPEQVISSQARNDDVDPAEPEVAPGADADGLIVPKEQQNPGIVAADAEQLLEELQDLADAPPIQEVDAVDFAQEEEEDEVPQSSGPPTSAAAMQKALKSVSQPGKENRSRSLFERQDDAVRVDFGDGFDTQPTPGPSIRDKGKQRVLPSPIRKRARPVEKDDESEEDDEFETGDRSANVRERREQAPVAKKVRIDPSSSGAPPSHQPPQSSRSRFPPRISSPEQEDASLSEEEAPDMTESVPPPSSYQAQHRLALQNGNILSNQRERKPRTAWTYEEEEAFVNYMEDMPAKYSAILNHDNVRGRMLLQDRTQINLKDKARTMAINMIKSGTGLKPGFENIIKPSTKDGKSLLDQGFVW